MYFFGRDLSRTKISQKQNGTNFRTILGRNSLKNERKRKKKNNQRPWHEFEVYLEKERKKFSLKSKRIYYYFEEFNTLVRKVL